MKYASLIITLFFAKMAAAQTCAPASKEMAQYYSQRTLRAVSVGDGTGVKPVKGYVDEKNNFIFEDLSRSGEFAAQLKIDPANPGNREFFKYCRSGKGSFLRSMRKSGPFNKYTVSLRYLPSLTGFGNNPLVDQKYNEHTQNLRVQFDPAATISVDELYPDKVKQEFQRMISKQTKAAKEFGYVEIDLSGWDDAVCDMINGKIKVTIERGGLSTAALVEMKKEVEASDLINIHRALKDQVPATMTKEKALFVAGRVMAKLEMDRNVPNLGDKKGFELLKSLMTPDMSKIADLQASDVSCLADRMQTYSRSFVPNWMFIQIKLPALSELEERN